MVARVEIEGLKEFRKSFKAAGGDMKEMKAAGAAAAEIVARDARGSAPRGRTGRLAESVRAAGQQTGAVVRAGSAKRVPYAAYVHFGVPSRGMAPQPFLYDALDRRRGEVEATYSNALDEITRKAGLT